MWGKIQGRENQQVAMRKITVRASLIQDTVCAMSMRLVLRMASKSLVRICLEEYSEHTLTPGRGNNYFCKKPSQKALGRWMHSSSPYTMRSKYPILPDASRCLPHSTHHCYSPLLASCHNCQGIASVACLKLAGKSASRYVVSSLRHTPKYLGLVNNLTQANVTIWTSVSSSAKWWHISLQQNWRDKVLFVKCSQVWCWKLAATVTGKEVHSYSVSSIPALLPTTMFSGKLSLSCLIVLPIKWGYKNIHLSRLLENLH